MLRAGAVRTRRVSSSARSPSANTRRALWKDVCAVLALCTPGRAKANEAAKGVCSASAAASAAMADNPLTTAFSKERGFFPPFETIKAEHVVPGVRALIADCEAQLAALEASASPTWDGVMEPLEALTDRLGIAWGAVKHLKSVRDTEALRAAVDEVQPERVQLSLRISQSEPIYKAVRALRDDKAQWASLSEAQKRAVDAELKDFELGGVGLTGDAKVEFNSIQQKLSAISTAFSNNLLDATKAFAKVVTDKDDVAGLPPSALAAAAAAARERAGHPEATAEAGPWALTLDMPVCASRATAARACPRVPTRDSPPTPTRRQICPSCSTSKTATSARSSTALP